MRTIFPSIDSLRAFEAAARHLSMHDAAIEMEVTPSAISYQVKRLETVIGTYLFDRRSSGITLTTAGQFCLGETRQLLDRLASETAALSQNVELDRISIGLSYALSELWLAPVLPSLLLDFPDLKVEVFSETSGPNDSIDLADIVVSCAPTPPDSTSLLLFHEELSPCCSEDYLHHAGPIENTADLLKCTRLSCPDEADNWTSWFRAEGVAADPIAANRLVLDSELSELYAARVGIGVTLANLAYLNKAAGQPNLVRLFDRTLSTGRSFFANRSQQASQHALSNRILDWLVSA